MEASKNGHAEIVDKLIKNGAKINHKRFFGDNIFICACRYKREKVIRILLL